MNRVLLIHTGGTLGMSGRRPQALKPSSFFRTVQQRAPELLQLASLELELFSNIDSSEMQPEMWSKLAERIYQRLPDFDGVVVTHGTDTLAYTASALSYMLPNLNKPVVVTGAQRPLGEIRSDARLNLIDAVTSALKGPAEVTVCFDSHLYRGNRVRKVSIAEYDAFDSPNCPPLGVLGVDVRFTETTKPSKKAGKPKLLAKCDPRVFLLKVHPGLDPRIPLAILPFVKGLVVEAHGAGNFPVSEELGRSLRGLFKEARKQKIPVLMVSQAHRNGVELSLYEAGSVALSEGAMSGGDMTSAAAVAKLMHGLAWHRTLPALKRYLEANVAGERSVF